MPLLDALVQRQVSLGLGDGRFAASLGMSRRQWSATKRGTRSVGDKLLDGVLLHYTELAPAVLDFLRARRESGGVG